MAVTVRRSASGNAATQTLPYILSSVIIALIALASAVGLFVDDFYRNNLWASSQFRGSDLVRLAVVVPIFVVTVVAAARGSRRAQLIWLGMLWLTVYDYAFYLFGAAFNELFLVYVLLFTLSVAALILGLSRHDATRTAACFKDRTPVAWIGGYMLTVAAFLGVLWTVQSIAFVFTGQPPQSLIDSGHVTEIVFALDLSLLVPGMTVGAIWLWQRRAWGYVLAGMMMVKATLYPMALIGMSVFASAAGVAGAGGLTVFWVIFAAASMIASAFLFGNMRATALLRDPT